MQLRWAGLHLARSLCDRFYQLNICTIRPHSIPPAKKNPPPNAKPGAFSERRTGGVVLVLCFGCSSRREIDRERELGTVKIGLVRDTSQVLNTAWGLLAPRKIHLGRRISLCRPLSASPAPMHSRMPPHILQLGRLLCSNYSPSVFLCRREALCAVGAVLPALARCFGEF